MGDIYIAQSCRDQFYYMKYEHKWQYIIYKFNSEDPTFLEIFVCGHRGENFEKFKNKMPKTDPCCAVYDFGDGRESKELKDKVVFFIYWPDKYSLKNPT